RKELFMCTAALLLKTKWRGFGNGWQEIIDVGEARERHPKDAVGEERLVVRNNFHRQSGFADASRTCERQ
ncbi:MAG TPA: hypothetical protein VKR06_00370, partial [Ktedonosporobacter sp.]|nr:hypothetical protein [Ktedonosporobacter sp.]